jgi:hypothetical protein
MSLRPALLCALFCLCAIVAMGQEKRGKRFVLSTAVSMNVTSAATTNGADLKDNYSGKLNYSLRLGYWFWFPGDWALALESGGAYRDFGFTQNQSTIPYIAIPALLRVRIGKGFLRTNFYGGAEFNRLYPSMYRYPDPNNPSNSSYNLFLHQNDAVTGLYGIGLVFGKRGLKVEVYTENLIQLDSFDRQFGRTIGARTLGLALHLASF